MIQQKCAELFNYTSQAFEPVSIAVLFVFEHRRLEEFVGVGVADSGGGVRSPVLCRSTPFNTQLAFSIGVQMTGYQFLEVF